MPWAEQRIVFAGHAMQLHASGVLYWPAQQLLIASDLHLEKATFLAQHGSALPPYDTLDTLERLEQAIAHYRPARLALLGDSFHDAFAWQRLDAALRARIEALAHQVPQLHWIEGNHDIGLRGNHHFEPALHIEGVVLTHDFDPDAPYQIIGHYHPKTTLKIANRTIHGRCFATTPHLLMMPAFGSFTGGLSITDPAIRRLAGEQEMASYLLYQQGIYRMPGA